MASFVHNCMYFDVEKVTCWWVVRSNNVKGRTSCCLHGLFMCQVIWTGRLPIFILPNVFKILLWVEVWGLGMVAVKLSLSRMCNLPPSLHHPTTCSYHSAVNITRLPLLCLIQLIFSPFNCPLQLFARFDQYVWILNPLHGLVKPILDFRLSNWGCGFSPAIPFAWSDGDKMWPIFGMTARYVTLWCSTCHIGSECLEIFSISSSAALSKKLLFLQVESIKWHVPQ